MRRSSALRAKPQPVRHRRHRSPLRTVACRRVAVAGRSPPASPRRWPWRWALPGNCVRCPRPRCARHPRCLRRHLRWRPQHPRQRQRRTCCGPVRSRHRRPLNLRRLPRRPRPTRPCPQLRPQTKRRPLHLHARKRQPPRLLATRRRLLLRTCRNRSSGRPRSARRCILPPHRHHRLRVPRPPRLHLYLYAHRRRPRPRRLRPCRRPLSQRRVVRHRQPQRPRLHARRARNRRA